MPIRLAVPLPGPFVWTRSHQPSATRGLIATMLNVAAWPIVITLRILAWPFRMLRKH